MVLTLIDEHARECPVVHLDRSMRAVDVIAKVEAAMARYGVLTHVRSDNGPESIAYAIQDWLKSKHVKTIYITPDRRGRSLTLRASTTSYGTNV